MFPLLNKDKENPLELFQIWINLPRKDKFAPPHFKMLWDQEIPKIKQYDSSGKETEVSLIAGQLGDSVAPAPAPDSWAAKPENEVGIWLIRMEAEATWKLPAASPETERSMYFYKGDAITIAGIEVENYQAIELLGDLDIIIQSGKQEARMVLLQGRPIAEPVAQYGPFVMNTQEEIHQAISDFRRTQFGGWPWPRYDNVHERESLRFAKYANGHMDQP
jgi:redox-sensitive bicupin YhaK (pirin superfamily)